MRKLVAVSTACLIVITLILVRREWSEYWRVREAEVALAQLENIKPPRFRTLPGPEGGADSEQQEPLVVTVDVRGGVKLGAEDAGTLADLGPLREKLMQALSGRGGRRPDHTVFIKAPQSLKYVEVARLVEAVKEAGANPVGLETDFSK